MISYKDNYTETVKCDVLAGLDLDVVRFLQGPAVVHPGEGGPRPALGLAADHHLVPGVRRPLIHMQPLYRRLHAWK